MPVALFMRQKDWCDPVVALNICDKQKISCRLNIAQDEGTTILSKQSPIKWSFGLVGTDDSRSCFSWTRAAHINRTWKDRSCSIPASWNLFLCLHLLSFLSPLLLYICCSPRYPPPPPLSSPPCAVNDGHNEWIASLLSAPAALTSLVYWEAVWFSLACQISRIVFAGDCR